MNNNCLRSFLLAVLLGVIILFPRDSFNKDEEIFIAPTIINEPVEISSKMIYPKSFEENSVKTEEEVKIVEVDLREVASEQFRSKMIELEECNDTQQWYIEYKEMLNELAEYIEIPETIYDYYTNEEIDFFCRVVQAEIGDEYGFIEKANVASVILNRIEDEKFGNTINTVLTKNQFSTIATGKYKTVKVSDKTKMAVEFAFEIKDTTNGALYFEGGKSNVHDAYAEYIFTDNSGHKFYK